MYSFKRICGNYAEKSCLSTTNTGEKTLLRRKAHLTSSKEVATSFSKKPKEATKSSINKINFVSMDNESLEVPKSSTRSVLVLLLEMIPPKKY